MIIASTTAQLQRFQTGPLAALLAIQFSDWLVHARLTRVYVHLPCPHYAKDAVTSGN